MAVAEAEMAGMYRYCTEYLSQCHLYNLCMKGPAEFLMAQEMLR